MSRIVAGIAAGAPSGDATGPVRSGRSRRPSPVTALIFILTLLGLALRLYLALRPGLMAVTQYDDGPYFGSAVRLVHGGVPYRDFAFVQPPGITLLMSPIALVSYLTGTAGGLVIARLVTVAAGTAAIALAGLLVRHRGMPAVLLACGLFAVYPPSAAASHTVLLEPWLVLFCLAGAVAVFDGDRLAASTRRLAWGGAAFGFAGAVKLWAIAPVIVIAVLLLPRLRRAAVFAAGVAAGFLLPVLPFAAVAPRQFYDSVIVAQVARVGARVPVSLRLQAMLGVVHEQAWKHHAALAAMLAVLVFVAGAQVAARVATHRPPPVLDWFAMLTAALVVVIFLWPQYFAAHYAAFLAPFLALALALATSRLLEGGRLAARRSRGIRSLGGSLAGVTVLALVAAAVFQAPVTAGGGPPRVLPAAAERVIPAGACVVSDQATYLLLANRFVSGVAGCPLMVDSLGTDLALSGGRRPGSGAAEVPAVAAAWRHAFHRAGYILLSSRNGLRVPWTSSLRRYLERHFRLVQSTGDYTVYARTGLPW